MDGYADIQFLEEPGAINNSYKLYVWDDFERNFAKVKYDGMLSYFEVHDGYLECWGKNDANSGVIEKLVWEGNNLIKESEENYEISAEEPDESQAPESMSNSELIAELFSFYEVMLIQAINNNDFSAIEELLVGGSNLYNSQKKLVENLYIKNTQEKLIEYKIKEIKSTGTEGEYKAYITEKIGIKYSGKQDHQDLKATGMKTL
jgi:hypothetical protein